MGKKDCVNRNSYVVVALVVVVALFGSFRYLSGYASVSGSINGREMPICSVDTEEKKVALTFETTWGNSRIGDVLDILKRLNVRATFFITGNWAEKYPEDVRAIFEAGHDLGNHSGSHRNMTQMSEEEKTEELMGAHKKVKELTGTEMNLFRAPYGACDDRVILNAGEHGYYTIGWDVDSLDWKDYGVDAILASVLENGELKNGSIILLHSEAKYTADALEDLIAGLRERGYEPVPVSELIYKDGYHLDVTGRQIAD